jgi:hypothetical protein
MNKKTISLLIVLSIAVVAFYLCTQKKEQNKESKKDMINGKYWLADSELKDNREKITLLSILKNTSKDTVTIVLRDYLLFTENDSISFEKVIAVISEKHQISKHRIASIVFSYKYEMLTQEDVIDDYLEDENESNYRQSTSSPDGYSDRY